MGLVLVAMLTLSAIHPLPRVQPTAFHHNTNLVSTQQEQVTITHYGYPNTFNGNPMGCRPYPAYHSTNPTILAVGYSRDAQIPCWTEVEITGPNGTITAVRQDTCHGCRHSTFDLSDAASLAVCGLNRSGQLYTCQATIRVLE